MAHFLAVLLAINEQQHHNLKATLLKKPTPFKTNVPAK